jgi:hypothetical protein
LDPWIAALALSACCLFAGGCAPPEEPRGSRALFATYAAALYDRSGVPSYLCGYIDRSGTVVVPPVYDHAGDFREGLAIVGATADSMTCIDDRGRALFTVPFSLVSDFREGRAIVIDKDLMIGLIDTTGDLIVPPRFKYLVPFSEGLAAASLTDRPAKYGFIDRSGRFVIHPRFARETFFSEGLAPVEETLPDGTEKRGYIDKTGRYVIEPKGQVHWLTPFSGGLAAVLWAERAVFIDRCGKTVISGPFGSARRFSEGMAAIRVSPTRAGKWGYIDRTGRLRIPVRFDNAHPFSNGLAAVRIGGKWGYVDKNGEMVIAPRYTKASQFRNDLAVVESQDKSGSVIRTSYIDRKGQTVWTTDCRVPHSFFEPPKSLY